MKNLIVKMDYLDRMAAVIVSEKLPIIIDNNPLKTVGTCRVFRNAEGRCVAELELENEVSEDLFFYYTSLNQENGYWFTGLSLAHNLYNPDKIASRLSEMII